MGQNWHFVWLPAKSFFDAVKIWALADWWTGLRPCSAAQNENVVVWLQVKIRLWLPSSLSGEITSDLLVAHKQAQKARPHYEIYRWYKLGVYDRTRQLFSSTRTDQSSDTTRYDCSVESHTSRAYGVFVHHDPSGGIAMVWAPGHHLSTGVVEDDHTEEGRVGSFLKARNWPIFSWWAMAKAAHP
jgi:hypothetical protein